MNRYSQIRMFGRGSYRYAVDAAEPGLTALDVAVCRIPCVRHRYLGSVQTMRGVRGCCVLCGRLQ